MLLMASTSAGAGLITFAAASTVLYLIYRRWRQSNSGFSPQPLPGPFGLPYVGSPWSITPCTPFVDWHNMSKKYGPIFQMEIMGEKLVIVTSKTVYDLFLAKAATRFNSRPNFAAITGPAREIPYVPLMKGSRMQRLNRKISTQAIASMPKEQAFETTHRIAFEYISALLKDPMNGKNITEKYVSQITTEMSWADPSAADKNNHVARQLVWAVSPGSALLSKLPFLANLWNRLPDACQPWKTYEHARRADEMAFWTTQESRAATLTQLHDSKSSASSDHQQSRWTLSGEIQRLYKAHSDEPTGGLTSSDVTGMLTVIGSLLLSTPVMTYLIAMTSDPRGAYWQDRLARELREVLGPDRSTLPRTTDLPRLPVLRAVMREVLRWRPPVPNNAPHVCETAANVYTDPATGTSWSIPRGASIIYHPWSLERDPERFPDPEAFRPERWLEPTWPTFKEPLTVHPRIGDHPGFGWGVRACVGVAYVEVVVAALIAGLARNVFVKKAVDPGTGKEIEVNSLDYEPFTLFVRPRSWAMGAVARGDEEEGEMKVDAQVVGEKVDAKKVGTGSHLTGGVTASGMQSGIFDEKKGAVSVEEVVIESDKA